MLCSKSQGKSQEKSREKNRSDFYFVAADKLRARVAIGAAVAMAVLSAASGLLPLPAIAASARPSARPAEARAPQQAASSPDLSGQVKDLDTQVAGPTLIAPNESSSASAPLACAGGEKKALIAYQFSKPNIGASGFGSAFVCAKSDDFSSEEGLRRIQGLIERNIAGAVAGAPIQKDDKKARAAVGVAIMNVIILRK